MLDRAEAGFRIVDMTVNITIENVRIHEKLGVHSNSVVFAVSPQAFSLLWMTI